jgi:hypothetical protein
MQGQAPEGRPLGIVVQDTESEISGLPYAKNRGRSIPGQPGMALFLLPLRGDHVGPGRRGQDYGIACLRRKGL